MTAAAAAAVVASLKWILNVLPTSPTNYLVQEDGHQLCRQQRQQQGKCWTQ
jgi:hypothetical protein